MAAHAITLVIAKAEDAPKSNGKQPQLVTSPSKLPAAVQEMYENIINAAKAGDLEELRDIFETNELAPVISNDHTGKPIEHWKKTSLDGSARDIMATLVEIFSRPPVKTSEGDFVWPSYARRPLKDLSKEEQIDLFRMAGAKAASAMLKTGTYDYYEAKIGPDGTWHSFIKVTPGETKP